MRNNDCIHDFGSWKKIKKPVLELESTNDNCRAELGNDYERRCRLCGIRDTKFEPIKKKNKTLGLKMNGINKKEV